MQDFFHQQKDCNKGNQDFDPEKGDFTPKGPPWEPPEECRAILLQYLIFNTWLVGSFNPFEKYGSKWESSLNRGEQENVIWNPPPSRLVMDMLWFLSTHTQNQHSTCQEDFPKVNSSSNPSVSGAFAVSFMEGICFHLICFCGGYKIYKNYHSLS